MELVQSTIDGNNKTRQPRANWHMPLNSHNVDLSRIYISTKRKADLLIGFLRSQQNHSTLIDCLNAVVVLIPTYSMITLGQLPASIFVMSSESPAGSALKKEEGKNSCATPIHYNVSTVQ